MIFNAIRSIYRFEMARTWRTLECRASSRRSFRRRCIFVVFGSAIGSRISQVGGISYGVVQSCPG